MTDREIYCTGCNKYLGLIRDALLHPKIKYICPTCETKRKASDMKNNITQNNATQNNNNFMNMINDILTGKK